MEDCKIVRFNNTIVTKINGGNCDITSDFILYNEKFNIRLHLGVIKGQADKQLYVPQTFIPKRVRDRDVERITKGQTYMNIIERFVE